MLPMDGYHDDGALLDARGLRHVLERLGREDEVAVPVFDLGVEIVRAGARIIGRDTRAVVGETDDLPNGRLLASASAAPDWVLAG